MSPQVCAGGWLAGARWLPSPHCHRFLQTPRLLAVHGISLPAGEFGGDAALRLFAGTLAANESPQFASLRGLRVSAHFLIRRCGELWQFVSCHNAAWHAGDSEWRGQKNCNDFSWGAELEGADDIPYEDAQYDALIALWQTLAQLSPRLPVAGHAHIAPGRKTDPGAAFDWRRLFAAIGGAHDGRA